MSKRRMEALTVAALLAVGAQEARAVGTPAGTVISSQATVNYEDTNSNPLSALSNVVTTTVSQVGGVTIAPNNSSSGAPSDVLYYAHTVTNAGNGTDTIDLTASSSQGWTIAFYLDVNGNGTYESGTDTPLADTDADLVPDTGALGNDAFVRILVAVTVPAGASDATVDVTTVTATSSFDTGLSANATDTTTVASPALTVVKSVAPVGAQPPGTQLTYTVVVTNGGSGNAVNVVLTDPIPTNTTYVGSSIQQDAASRTDGADADNADFNVTNAGQITVNIGSLASSASTTIEFQVTID